MIGKYFLAMFLSPLYFFSRGRTVAAIVHAVLYVVALLTLPVLGFGVLIWVALACHACWDLYSLMQERMADRVADKVAARMQTPR